MQASKSELLRLAMTLRQAILACPNDSFPGFPRRHLRDFPRQCCTVASLLLAHHLSDQGFQRAQLVCGDLEQEEHCWLEVDGWLVDITADQFPCVGDPVIVTRVTDESWHARLRGRSQGLALEYYPADGRANIESAYVELRKWIESAGQPKSGK